MDVLYVGNDHVMTLRDLRDAEGVFVGDATATAVLYEADGVTEVTGQAWPLTLNPSVPVGTYEAELSADIDIQDGCRYVLEISAVSVGKRYRVVRTVLAKVRYG